MNNNGCKNGNGRGCGKGNGNGNRQGCKNREGGNQRNCFTANGSQVQGKGKRRELFEQKYNEYLKDFKLPEFDTQEQYVEWMANTEEGKRHASNLDRINAEVDLEFPWGGRRENAGRKKECIRKIPYSRRISAEVLETLRTYAQEQNLTETEALEKAILSLKNK